MDGPAPEVVRGNVIGRTAGPHGLELVNGAPLKRLVAVAVPDAISVEAHCTPSRRFEATRYAHRSNAP